MVSVSLRNPGITRVDFAGRSIKDIQPFNMSSIQTSSVSFADLWGCKCVSANFQIVVTSLLTWTPTRRSHNTIEYTSAVIHDVTDVNHNFCYIQFPVFTHALHRRPEFTLEVGPLTNRRQGEIHAYVSASFPFVSFNI